MARIRQIGQKQDLQTETLQLVMEIEDQSRSLVDFCESCQKGDRSFGRFRDALRRVDDFYLFVDMVERKLQELDHPKKDLLKINVSQIRWKVFSISLAVLDAYTEEFMRDADIIPYGRKEVFQSRFNRIEELEEHFREIGKEHGLAPVDQVLVNRVKERLEKLVELAPALTEFSREEAEVAEALAEQAILLAHRKRPRSTPAMQKLGALSAHEPFVLDVRKDWGRIFVTRNQVIDVTRVAKMRGFDIEELARRMGMHRQQLIMMLNGQDPIPPQTLELIESLLSPPAPENDEEASFVLEDETARMDQH